MKIDAGTSYLHASQRAQSPAAPGNATSFADVLATATAGPSGSGAAGVKQVDISNMTRQEMRDWSNDQIRSGKMSLDDSRPFMAMTMKIPVSGGTGELPAANDGERLDFTQKVRAGIEGAVSRNDEVTRQMLQSAMAIMQRYQG